LAIVFKAIGQDFDGDLPILIYAGKRHAGNRQANIGRNPILVGRATGHLDDVAGCGNAQVPVIGDFKSALFGAL
jgi:hypothetical protein